jgi:hypothetical protein
LVTLPDGAGAAVFVGFGVGVADALVEVVGSAEAEALGAADGSVEGVAEGWSEVVGDAVGAPRVSPVSAA